MIEALVVLFIAATGFGVYLFLSRHPRTRPPQNPRERVAYVTQRLAWVDDRITRAEATAWDETTLAPLRRERDELRAALAALEAKTPKP